jgi:HAD superfamily hydrolase (TIGR01549 family)
LPDKPVEALNGRVVRCILFDLGSTLWFRGDNDTWEQLEVTANQRAVSLLREHAASHLPAHLDDLTLGSRLREAFSMNVRTLVHRNPEIEPDGPAVVMETLLQWGIKGIDISTGNAIFEALRVRIPESRPLYKDTLSTLATLQKRGFILGVVTNRVWGGQPFLEDMRTLALDHFFDLRKIAVSADLRVRKPNTAIFLHALNELKVAPEEAVMVGDSLGTDVVGAQRLGIFAVWKPKLKVRERIKAHLLATTTPAGEHNVQQMRLMPEKNTRESTAKVPLSGMSVTDVDHMLTKARRSDFVEKYLSGAIVPDLIIEHLSELRDLLIRVGMQ